MSDVVLFGVSMSQGEYHARQRMEAISRLREKGDISRYRGACGERYLPPSNNFGGATVAALPELVGTPLCNASLALIHSLNPSVIRVTTGECTTDSRPGRVTVFVDEFDVIRGVEQEATVAYTNGADVMRVLQEMRDTLTPATT